MRDDGTKIDLAHFSILICSYSDEGLLTVRSPENSFSRNEQIRSCWSDAYMQIEYRVVAHLNDEPWCFPYLFWSNLMFNLCLLYSPSAGIKENPPCSVREQLKF